MIDLGEPVNSTATAANGVLYPATMSRLYAVVNSRDGFHSVPDFMTSLVTPWDASLLTRPYSGGNSSCTRRKMSQYAPR